MKTFSKIWDAGLRSRVDSIGGRGEVNQGSDAAGEKPHYRALDIAHTANILSQFNDCFNKVHWEAAKKVLRYLKGTSDQGIFYKRDDLSLVGYADADKGDSLEDRRSFMVYVFIMNDEAIAWNLKKQPTVALRTTKAEYMALSEAAKEAVFFCRSLE